MLKDWYAGCRGELSRHDVSALAMVMLKGRIAALKEARDVLETARRERLDIDTFTKVRDLSRSLRARIVECELEVAAGKAPDDSYDSWADTVNIIMFGGNLSDNQMAFVRWVQRSDLSLVNYSYQGRDCPSVVEGSTVLVLDSSIRFNVDKTDAGLVIYARS